MPDGFTRRDGRMVPTQRNVAGPIGGVPPPPNPQWLPTPAPSNPVAPTFVATGPRQGTDSADALDYVLVNKMLWLQPGGVTNITSQGIGNFVNGPVSTVPGDAAVWGNTAGTMLVDPGWAPAPLVSPAFTGTPTAPTPGTGDNSQAIATTAFVTNLLQFRDAPANGISYVRNTNQWVQFTGSTVGLSPPPGAANGSLWWDSTGGQLYVYFDDGNSRQWVVANSVIAQGGPFLPLSGGTVSGNLTVEYPGTVNKMISAPTHPSAAYIDGSTQFGSYYTPAAAGGTAGQVSANGTFYSSITGSPTENIWNLIAVADYSGPGGNGQHVAIDSQALRRTVNAGGSASNPQLWSYNCQVIDYTNADSAQTNTLSAIEIGFNCGNTDSANNRRIIGVYLDRANTTDVAPVCNLGLHMQANHGSFNWITRFDAPFNTAAIDTRGSTQNSGAHAIWLGDNKHVAWDSAGANTSYWDPAIFSGSGGLHQHANVQVDGSLYTAAALIVGGTSTLAGTVGGAGITALLAPYAPLASPTFTGTTTVAGLAATGTVSGAGFSNYLASPPAIGGTAAAAGTFTNLAASGTVSGAGFTNLFATPPAIGGTTPAAGHFTTVGASGQIVATLAGGGSASAFLASSGASSLPAYGWADTAQGTDMKYWDAIAISGSLNFRAVNDADSAATTWLNVSRSGYVPQTITLTAPHITLGSGLTNAANDAAAASAGIAVNGLYRNGSVVQIRVT